MAPKELCLTAFCPALTALRVALLAREVLGLTVLVGGNCHVERVEVVHRGPVLGVELGRVAQLIQVTAYIRNSKVSKVYI